MLFELPRDSPAAGALHGQPMECPGCGESRMVEYDPVLERRLCAVGADNQDLGWARRPAKRFHKMVNGADVSGPAGIAIRKRDPSDTTAQSPCERGI